MEWFDKGLTWTIRIGLTAIGVIVGLCILRIAIAVAGVMLGSGIGTIFLGLIAWSMYKSYRKEH